MNNVAILLKPVSAACQLRCRYCFYRDEAEQRMIHDFGVMGQELQEKVIAGTMDAFDSPVTITYMFQGGEPTLAGISWYESFVAKVKAHKKPWHTIHYAIQTNGMLIDEEWADLFARNQFLVGISIDGDLKDHNRYRRDQDDHPVFTKVIAGYHLLRKKQVEVNVLSVLSEALAHHPDRYYCFLQKEDVQWAQIIPCLAPLYENSEYTLTPASYASFFCRVYDLWMKEAETGKIRHISLFDDILNLFQGKMPSQCGRLGYCQAQFVVEADGSVYPCDFYALDEWKCGSFARQTLPDIAENPLRRQFENRVKNTNALCQKCRWRQKCGGGCARMRKSFLDTSFCGHRQLLDHMENRLLALKK